MHKAFIRRVKKLCQNNTPFFFTVDFEKQFPQVFTWEEAAEKGFYFSINGQRNFSPKEKIKLNTEIKIKPILKDRYSVAFKKAIAAIKHGDSFLMNLTFPTEIELNCQLEDVFFQAKSPYKLYKKNTFTVFSPECFIKIKKGHIYTYPMKGTIDAKHPNAVEMLQKNPKERFEHNTIVDLMRNDLSMVAKEVKVTRFRYLESISTAQGELLQTSTEIRGKLPSNWKTNLGELILSLLPAGSISGAPKEKTCSLIKTIEEKNRGNYTGVFGVFDGETLDSGVMIRYIEHKKDRTYFHSGGGITSLSNEADEYQELLQKIYLPIF